MGGCTLLRSDFHEPGFDVERQLIFADDRSESSFQLADFILAIQSSYPEAQRRLRWSSSAKSCPHAGGRHRGFDIGNAERGVRHDRHRAILRIEQEIALASDERTHGGLELPDFVLAVEPVDIERQPSRLRGDDGRTHPCWRNGGNDRCGIRRTGNIHDPGLRVEAELVLAADQRTDRRPERADLVLAIEPFHLEPRGPPWALQKSCFFGHGVTSTFST
ncbi:MAG: hypothetical protein AB1490_11875 [Pseudomonadota bacterium]